MSKPIFISYSTDDTASAEQVRDALETAGLTCWMAPRDIAPGLEYGSQIVAAIEECSVLVLLLSESSNRSRFVLNEVERAVSKDKIVIPVRIHDVQPSRSLEFFISNAQWIDALDGPMDAHIASLETAVRAHLTASDVTQSPEHPFAQPSGQQVTISAIPSPSHLTDNRRSNLPTPSTPLVGRSVELAEITAKLADPACRLVTLAGHGGIGKTRLAMEIAHGIRDEANLMPNGVFFVALDNLSTPQQIAPAITKALDLAGAAQTDPRSVLLTFLTEKQLLLVLDNFEHLLEGADLVGDILASAPGVKILATSRDALNLQEEWFHPIGGLDLPQAVGSSSEEKLASSAVQLFAVCARRARPGFDLDTDIEAVVELCHLVDGVPLALELAAAWLRSLTCAQVVEELQSSLDMLATTMRNVPQRHRSMEAVFEQSWLMLEEREQTLLCQLAVFAGGFDWPAAKAVSGSSMATMMQLVSSSWAQVDEDGRYTLVPLVRGYLLARLNDEYVQLSGESPDRVRDRHSNYYVTLLHSVPTVEREREVPNLRAGWRHALAHFDDDSLRAFIARFFPDGAFLVWPGAFQDVEELLVATERRFSTALTRRQDASSESELRLMLAHVQCHRAVESNRAGFTRRAESLCRMSLATLNLLEDSTQAELQRTFSLGVLGWILISQSRLREADEATTQAQGLAISSSTNQLGLLHNFAYSAEEQGRYVEAADYLDRALAMWPEEHSLIVRRGSVSYLTGAYEDAAERWTKSAQFHSVTPRFGRLEWEVFWARLDAALGKVTAARQRLLAVVTPLREYSIKPQLGLALGELGRIALAQSAPDEAQDYFQEMAQIGKGLNRGKVVAGAWVGMGNVALAQNAFADSAIHMRQALALAWPLGILPEAIAAVIGLAQVEARQGDRRIAASWLGMAVAHSATPHHIRLEAEALLASLAESAPDNPASLEEIAADMLASTEETSVDNTQ